MKDKLHYRDFEITTLPAYARQFRYQYEHKDFDGAPDAGDMRYGSCETIEQCIEAIDEWYEDQELADEFEREIRKLGFVSKREWHNLVANIDLSNPEKFKAFEDWKNNDGTKKGLLELN